MERRAYIYPVVMWEVFKPVAWLRGHEDGSACLTGRVHVRERQRPGDGEEQMCAVLSVRADREGDQVQALSPALSPLSPR